MTCRGPLARVKRTRYPQCEFFAFWHFSDLLARHNYFRFRMYCRRDVLVASLSAHDPSRAYARTNLLCCTTHLLLC
jgi:hypothetical protein